MWYSYCEVSHFRRRFLAVPTSATKARSTVSTFAASHGFSGDALCDVETSVGEAVANAIEHGNRMRGVFTVACSFERGILTIEVCDGGAGFDDSTKPMLDIGERRTPSLRGYGLYLMRTLMNRVTFKDGGTTVVLEKHLHAACSTTENTQLAP